MARSCNPYMEKPCCGCEADTCSAALQLIGRLFSSEVPLDMDKLVRAVFTADVHRPPH